MVNEMLSRACSDPKRLVSDSRVIRITCRLQHLARSKSIGCRNCPQSKLDRFGVYSHEDVSPLQAKVLAADLNCEIDLTWSPHGCTRDDGDPEGTLTIRKLLFCFLGVLAFEPARALAID